MAKDPDLNPALNTKCNIYYIALSTFTEEKAPKPLEYTVHGFQGASSSPVFSPDGKKAVFLSLLHPGYESDKSQIFLIDDIKKDTVKTLLVKGRESIWDRSPQVCLVERTEEAYMLR